MKTLKAKLLTGISATLITVSLGASLISCSKQDNKKQPLRHRKAGILYGTMNSMANLSTLPNGTSSWVQEASTDLKAGETTNCNITAKKMPA